MTRRVRILRLGDIEDSETAVLREMIRARFGSIARFARDMRVSRQSVYKAINGHPYMRKLKREILLELCGEWGE